LKVEVLDTNTPECGLILQRVKQIKMRIFGGL
jgi:hypothetical protein